MPENGTVKWFNPKKGFGFISPANGESDVFVHYTAINVPEGAFRTLNQGDGVVFDVDRRAERKGSTRRYCHEGCAPTTPDARDGEGEPNRDLGDDDRQELGDNDRRDNPFA